MLKLSIWKVLACVFEEPAVSILSKVYIELENLPFIL
jgi:hypothetical protein